MVSVTRCFSCSPGPHTTLITCSRQWL